MKAIYIYFLDASLACPQIHLLYQMRKKVKEIIINSCVAVNVCDYDDAQNDNVDEILIVIIITTVLWKIWFRWKR